MYLSKRSKWHIGQRTKENKNGCKILLRNRNIKSIKTLSNSLVSPQIKFFVFFKIIFKGHSEIKIKEVFHWDTSSIAWEVTVITLSVCLSLSHLSELPYIILRFFLRKVGPQLSHHLCHLYPTLYGRILFPYFTLDDTNSTHTQVP